MLLTRGLLDLCTISVWANLAQVLPSFRNRQQTTAQSDVFSAGRLEQATDSSTYVRPIASSSWEESRLVI